MLAVVNSGSLLGVEALPVQVEVNTGQRGDADLILVGLPDAAVKESRDRVSAAINNSGHTMPDTKTIINLAPGDVRKEGPLYDLPIALGILASTGQLEREALDNTLIAGELGLSGETRPIKGALALGLLARSQGIKRVYLPSISAREACLVDGIEVYAVASLGQATLMLEGRDMRPPERPGAILKGSGDQSAYNVDFAEVKGQQTVRRAVEVAVAGGHNLLMIGPPGSGKSMIAKRIPTIMPAPTLAEYLDILKIHSAVGNTLQQGYDRAQRPFRSPHHTISDAGLIGGGSIPGPGEISLAHHGVLFLDELPEFKRSALEVMRQPLEDGEVTISRSAGKITLPCAFMLVAAMNPCPCGYMGDPKRECRCAPPMVQRYRARISGPLLDRVDIHVEAPAVAFSDMRDSQPGESSASIKNRIDAAREIQAQRFGLEKQSPINATPRYTTCNARMGPSEVEKTCLISSDLERLLQQAMEQMGLSARAYHRILKVARTIADLAQSESIQANHLLEAIQFRCLDRRVFY